VGTRTDIGPIPLDDLDVLLNRESYLGGANIEGLVFKNYGHDLLIGEEYIPFLAAKFVSEKFKEQHIKNFKPGGNKIEEYMDSFATEARWLKVIQTLRDADELDFDPRDIGKLMKWSQLDLEAEYSDAIKDWFYNHHIKNIKRNSMRGFPEFYKRWLVDQEVDRQWDNA
jgi:hypothetical protein